MELSSLLTFIGVFVTILCLLVGIAYYGIRDRTYEDALREKGIQLDGTEIDKEKRKKKEVSKKSNGQQKPAQVAVNKPKAKKQGEDLTTDTNIDTEEEQLTTVEQVVKKNKVKNTAPAPQVEQQQKAQPKPSDNTNRTVSESSTGLKEKPKAAIKPNQTKKEPVEQVTNGYTDEIDNDDGFQVQGSRKDLKQRQQQQKDVQADNDPKPKRTIEALGKVNVKQLAVKQLAPPAQPPVITVANVMASPKPVIVQHQVEQSKPLASAPQLSPVVDVVSEKQVFLNQIKSLQDRNGDLERTLKDKNESSAKLQKELDV
jgi:hypothetical protein